MSAYPVMLDGSAVSALVVGGGTVASRKATALVEAGARVHVVAPRVEPALEQLAAGSGTLRLTKAAYASDHIGDALLIVAATDDSPLNARIAADARSRGRLVNVVDAPELGNCITPAVHHAGELVVAVSAGGVPGAAVRIRDSIATLLDARYSDAVRELAALRRTLLDEGRRDRWQEAASSLVAPDFCEQVESGRFAARIAEWR